MKKRFKDIIPAEKRSIRNIPLLTSEERGKAEKQIGRSWSASVSETTTAHNVSNRTTDGIKSSSHSHSTPHTQHASHDKLRKTDEIIHIPTRPIKNSLHTSVTFEKNEEDTVKDLRVLDTGQESYGEYMENNKTRDWRVWFVIGAVCLIVIYFSSFLFIRASVFVKPSKHVVTENNLVIPLKNIVSLPLVSEMTKTATIKASGTEKISRKATGTVVIYNSSNTTSQKLAINTRLETPDGHIFKTNNAVTVPSVSVKNGKKIAGSVEVGVTADQPGDDYNLGLKDFAIVGFKGTDNYTIFYARSKTPLTGGFVGTIPSIDKKELEKTVTSLKKDIESEIKKDIETQVANLNNGKSQTASSTFTDGLYLADLISLTYKDTVTKPSDDKKSASVTVTAVASSVAVSNSSLSKYFIKSDTNPKVEPEVASSTLENTTYYGDFSNMKVTFQDATTRTALLANGTVAMSTTIDTEAMALKISNLSREKALSVLKDFIDAETIEVRVKPWWFSTLPSASKINIYVEK